MLTGDRPLFIALEGSDGTGKTTQAALLAQWLTNQGRACVRTREPGASSIGPTVRQLVLHNDGDVAPWAEAMLFAADRAQHVHEVIAPALADGAVVITDRYIASSVVYQGIVRGLGAGEVYRINALATGGLVPDVTLVLDHEPVAALQRATGGGADRIEREGDQFQQQVRNGFLRLASGQEPGVGRLWGRVAVVDATGTREQVHQRILRALTR